MTLHVVLADANILFSRTLRDYFLYAAKSGAIQIHWSQEVMDEMSRNLRSRHGMSTADTAKLEGLMNKFLPSALVNVTMADHRSVDKVDMDPKDRHVLAAALSADADVLLTQNTKHFPRQWMTAHGMELTRAGALLERLVRDFPDKIVEAHEWTVKNSKRSEEEILSTLERAAGKQAAAAVRTLVSPPPAPAAAPSPSPARRSRATPPAPTNMTNVPASTGRRSRGGCALCGRPLRGQKSIERGMGPTCWKKAQRG